MSIVASSNRNQLRGQARRLLCGIGIVAVFVAALVCNTFAAESPATTWVPADALAVIAIRPGDVATQKNVGGLANEGMSKMFDEIGVAREKVEQLCMVVFPPKEKGMSPGDPAGIIRLKAGETATLKFRGDKPGEAKEHMGMTYQVAGLQAWAQADAQTLIFGREDDLKRLIENGATSKSPLVKSAHWQSLSGQPLAVGIDMQAVSGTVDLEEAPPPVKGMLIPIWSEVGELYLASRSDDTLKLVAILQGRNGQTLQKSKETLTAAQTVAKNMLAGLRPQVPAGGEGPAALIGTFMDIGDELLNSVKIYDLPESNTIRILASVGFDAQRVAALQQSVVESRKAAQRLQGLNNLKQLSLALLNFEAVHRSYPPAVLMGKDNKGGVPHSWRVAMLPYLDAQDLYDQYKFDEPWDSESNKQVLAKMPAVFRAPDDEAGSVNASYFAVVGPNTVFSKPEGVQIAGIRDGTSNTIALLESKMDIPWTKPVDIEISPDKPLPKLGGWRGEGYAAAFCDGACRVFNKGIEEKLLRALLSIDGGEAIDPTSFDQ